MPKFEPGEFALVRGAFSVTHPNLAKNNGKMVEILLFEGSISSPLGRHEGTDWYTVLRDDGKSFRAREIILEKLPPTDNFKDLMRFCDRFFYEKAPKREKVLHGE